MKTHSDGTKESLIQAYAIYDVVIIDQYTWNYETHVNYTFPDFRIAGVSVYTQSGRQISSLSDIQNERAVFARLDIGNLNIPANAALILSVFDNGRFYSVSVSTTGTTGLVTLPNNILASRIKVFVWEDLRTMNPATIEPLIIGGENL